MPLTELNVHCKVIRIYDKKVTQLFTASLEMLHNVFYMLFFTVQCIQCLLHNMQKAVLNIAIHLAVTMPTE